MLTPTLLPRQEKVKLPEIEEFPSVVSVEAYRDHECAGSILSRWQVLTAASCVPSSNNDSYFVRAGTVHSSIYAGTVHRIHSIKRHPGRQWNSLGYDLAILNLYDPIDLDDKTKKPATLFSKNEKIKTQAVGVTVGWSNLRNLYCNASEEISVFKLQSVELKFVARKECAEIYHKPVCSKTSGKVTCENLNLQEDETCVAVPGNHEALTTTRGDRGGPVYVDGKLAGVMSRWGQTSKDESYSDWPNIITLVAHYRDWIDDSLTPDIHPCAGSMTKAMDAAV